MQAQHIEFLKSLDKEQVHGTLQGILMRDDLSQAPFDTVAKHLLTIICEERKQLIKENDRMRLVMEQHGIYNSLNVLGKEE